MDGELMNKAMELKGVPKILLRNSIPADKSSDFAEDYELTPEYVYRLGDDGRVVVEEKPWTIKDDRGIKAHSLLASPVAVSLLDQLYSILIK